MRKIKCFALIIVFAVLSFSLYAQEINFAPNFKQGQKLSYYLFHNKYNPNNSDYIRNSDTVIINFEVVSANKKGYVLAMQHNFSKLLKPSNPEGLEKVSRYLLEQLVELQLDSSGKYISIANYKNLQSKTDAFIKNEINNASPTDKESWKYWSEKVSTQAQMEALLMSDIEFFFMLFGSDLINNTTINYDDELQYRKYTLAATTSLTVSEDSTNKELIDVKMYTLPQEESNAAILEQLRKMAKEQEDNPNVMPEKQMFELQDFYAFVYNSTTKNLQKATYLRYERNGTKELVNEWFFKLAN